MHDLHAHKTGGTTLTSAAVAVGHEFFLKQLTNNRKTKNKTKFVRKEVYIQKLLFVWRMNCKNDNTKTMLCTNCDK